MLSERAVNKRNYIRCFPAFSVPAVSEKHALPDMASHRAARMGTQGSVPASKNKKLLLFQRIDLHPVLW